MEDGGELRLLQGYYKARQLKRIDDPLKRAEFWEKLNQDEEPVTRKRVSEGVRKEKATGPVTMYGKPYDLGKWGGELGAREAAGRADPVHRPLPEPGTG